jgi:probable phosphoglycerate mutase
VTLRLLLVRHGLSSFNVERRVQGRDDLSALTDEGRRQAVATGAALQGLPITAAYTSPLSRARDSARLLLERHGAGLQARLDEDLLEVDLGPWSGLLSRDLPALFPEEYRLWREAPERLAFLRADGTVFHPVQDLMEQARAFLNRLLQRHPPGGDSTDRTVLVVAHNAILRCLLLSLLELPAAGFRRFRLDNAGLSVLNLQEAGGGGLNVQLESLNGIGHLALGLPARGAGPRLLLVRHGETDWNRQGRFQGQMDIPLNPTGWEQAAAASRFLQEVPITRAYTSAMARPRQTAETILSFHPGVPLTSVQGLVEIGHGLWEGRLEAEIAEGWPQLLADWKREPHTVQMPAGENLQQVWDRSIDAWTRIAAGLSPQETALVVAHDAVNKTILCHLLGLTPGDIWMVKQGNGGVTVIDWPAQGEQPQLPVVTCLNLTSHLGGVLDRTAAGAL